MQLKLIPMSDGIVEWAMIELQGTLETNGTLAGQRIGNLKWENDKAVLHVGHHILEGKEVKLQNPFIVLKQDVENDGMIRIAAIIRTKVQFRSRPMPVQFV